MKTYTIEEKNTIEEIIRECSSCSVGLIDKNGLPYVVPMSFGYQDGCIYMHSAPEGFLIDSLNRNPNVCITFCTPSSLIWQHPDVGCSYRLKAGSVICRGKVSFLEDEDFHGKKKILDILMSQYVQDKKFTYAVPALKNVKVWKVEVEDFSCKKFGVHHPNSKKYNPEVDDIDMFIK